MLSIDYEVLLIGVRIDYLISPMETRSLPLSSGSIISSIFLCFLSIYLDMILVYEILGRFYNLPNYACLVLVPLITYDHGLDTLESIESSLNTLHTYVDGLLKLSIGDM